MGSSDDKSAEVFLPVLLFLLSLLRFEKNALNEKPGSLLIQNDDNVAFEDCTSSSSHFLTLVVKVAKGKKAGHSRKEFDRETDSVSSCPKCSISSTAITALALQQQTQLPSQQSETTSLPHSQAVAFCSSSSSTPTTPTRNIPSIITTDGGERGRRTFIVVAQSDKETQQRKKSIQSIGQVHQEQLNLSVNDDCNNAGISGECIDTTAPYRLPEITSTPPSLIISVELLSFILPNIQYSHIKAAKLLLCITAYYRVSL